MVPQVELEFEECTDFLALIIVEMEVMVESMIVEIGKVNQNIVYYWSILKCKNTEYNINNYYDSKMVPSEFCCMNGKANLKKNELTFLILNLDWE